MPSDCVFCRIVNHELPSLVVWEDADFLAILDLYPSCEGKTVVLTKKHYPSDLAKMPDEVYRQMFLACRRVSEKLVKSLGVVRCGIVLEGTGINHAHVKIYPLAGSAVGFEPDEGHGQVYYAAYPGYLDTRGGPKADLVKLKALAEKITNN